MSEPLCQRLARREPSAYAELYDLYAAPLFRYLQSRLGSRADAEDVLQETFLRLARNGDWSNKVKELAPYLFTVARNEANRLRSKKGLPAYELLPGELSCQPLVAASNSLEDQEWLTMALGRLNAAHFEIIQLKVYGQLTLAETAQVLDIPPGTAATRYRSALEQLRAMLPRDENARL